MKEPCGYYVKDANRTFVVDTTIVSVRFIDTKTISSYNVIRINKLGYADLVVPNGVSYTSYINQLKQDTNISNIDIATIGEYNSITSNDTYLGQQWYLSAINASSAWDITMGSSNVIVAIIDSGTDWMHDDIGFGYDSYQTIHFNPGEDLWSNINNPSTGNGIDDDNNELIDDLKGWNYANNSNDCRTTYFHGTFVAGIIGAKTNNNTGIAGIASGYGIPGVRLLPYCVGVNYPITDVIDDAIIDAVDKGAKIIQLSLTVPRTTAITTSVDYAVSHGAIVICASGNSYSQQVSYPSSLPNVVAVGAINQSYARANFSNYGDTLDVVAPGVDIYSTTLNNTYATYDGTSFAAPQVSGIAALILSVNPNLTGQQVRDIIETTAQKIRNVDTDPLNGLYSYAVSSDHPNGSWNNQVGYGLVDAYAAVQAAVNYNTDLYVRDYATDDGTEPSVTDNMWNSPDIWLENLYGNVIQNPTGGTPCYVCVEVHNRNNIASSGTETLFLNWAKAGVDLQWNHNWTGANYFNCGGTYVAKGGVIGNSNGIVIPAIPANSSTVVRVLWTPPMPSNYSNCTEFNTDPWHFCLAARVHDGNTIPNENSTNYGMGAFTLNSNNVAWKNISIMNSSVNTAVVSVSKPANMTSSLSIEYVEHPNTYGETLSQFARVNMYFDTNLTSAWNLGGSHFSGVKVNGTGEFMVINDTAVLSDIMLDTGLVCTMLTEVNFLSNKTPKDNVFEFDIMLYSGTTFIGAEHYVAIKDKKSGIKAIARDDTKSFAGDEVTFYAETNNSNVSYKWYSQNGETLGTGTDLTVYPRQSQSYILEVKSDDEGFIDMDTVCVQICRGAIVGLSPNPTSDILNIEYRLEENISSATVSISNGLGIVMRTIPVSNTQNRNTLQTNIQGLTSGRYSVELKLPNGEILDAKSIIVQ